MATRLQTRRLLQRDAPDLRLIEGNPNPSNPRRGARLFAAICAGLIAIFVFGLVLLNVSLSESASEGARLKGERAKAEAEIKWLRSEVAAQSSPDRIAQEAAKAGLVVPSTQEFIEVAP